MILEPWSVYPIKVFNLLVEDKVDIGCIITAENGKAKPDAEGEVLFAASFFEWFSEEDSRFYGDMIPHSNATSQTHVIKQPVGVHGLITPWNFSIAMGVRKVAVALAAGCIVILKSDGVNLFSSNALAVLCERAGLPRGDLNVVTALQNTTQIGIRFCESDIIKKILISFAGSTKVGKLLMQQSSGTLKKPSLELGGNGPFIVFDDADLEAVVASALGNKVKVAGQTCVCANQMYVQVGIYDRFSQRLVKDVLQDGSVTHGRMAIGVSKVEEPVKDAKVLLGGNRLPSLGKNFHKLTILGDINDTMPVATEETFGPLAALFKFSTEDEVISRANTCDVRLASYVMTHLNLARSHQVTERLEFGMVALNTGVISNRPHRKPRIPLPPCLEAY